MNQFAKSGAFIAIAILCAVGAVLTQPSPTEAPLEEVGDRLFPNFADVTQVQSLQIIRPNNAKETVEPLHILRQGGRWVIASHQDYPADAADARERIIEAGLELQSLTVLDIRSDDERDHKLYGVIEPTDQNVLQSAGDEEIGTLIRVQDSSGSKLAEIIVGKSPEGQPNQRFVRRLGQTRVYICEFDPDKLSTDFADWIEGNLFSFDPQEIKQVTFNDTRVDEQPVVGPGGALLTTPDGQPVMKPVPQSRFKLTVNWNPADEQWMLSDFTEFRGGTFEKAALLENEELNTEKLNDMKNALNAIEIFNVEKIRGQIGSLKSDVSLLSDVAMKRSLREHGYYPFEISETDTQVKLLSQEGAVSVAMQNGLRYTLRFGKPAGLIREDGESKLNRYLLVAVDVDSSLISPSEVEQPPADAALQKEATQLSRRYGWYFVISEDIYKRLALSRFEIIKEKEGGTGFGIDDFRRLEREGIQPPQGTR